MLASTSSFVDLLAEAKNYCRNPEGSDDYVWCYTTDPNKRWDNCIVEMCQKREFSLVGNKHCTILVKVKFQVVVNNNLSLLATLPVCSMFETACFLGENNGLNIYCSFGMHGF